MTKENRPPNIGLWAMLTHIFIHAMNKGQLLTAGFLGLVALIIFKLPPEDLSKIVFEILHSNYFKYLGYVLFITSLISWKLHVKWQRLIMTKEVDRLAAERTRLQSQNLGGKIESSEEQL